MTEFALILPIFMVIVAGLLGFGRVFFYWIEANHVANESARWAIVDHNPYAPSCPSGPFTGAVGCQVQQHGANSATAGSAPWRSGDGLHHAHRDRSRRSAEGDRREALRVRPDPRYRQDHHPGILDDASREPRR